MSRIINEKLKVMTQAGLACSVFSSLARRLAVEWNSAAVMMALKGFLTAAIVQPSGL